MALTTTTLTAAITFDEPTISVASATGFSSGKAIRIGGEMMKVTKAYDSGLNIPVFRGWYGTKTQAHGVTSNVTVGPPAEFADPVETSTAPYPYRRFRQVKEYGAAGAITLPTPGNDMLAIINGTSALAMTVANPTKDADGDVLTILGNGKAAHTVTYTAGLGNGGSGLDVMTFDTNAQLSLMLIAANGIWVAHPSPLSGTLTGTDIAVA